MADPIRLIFNPIHAPSHELEETDTNTPPTKVTNKRIFVEFLGILWGTASNSNIDILQRFQNKFVRSITNAPWYVPSTILHTDLQIPTVKAEITNYSTTKGD